MRAHYSLVMLICVGLASAGCGKHDHDRDPPASSDESNGDVSSPSAPTTTMETQATPPRGDTPPPGTSSPPTKRARRKTAARARIGALSTFFLGPIFEETGPSIKISGMRPWSLCHTGDSVVWSNARGELWAMEDAGEIPRELGRFKRLSSIRCDGEMVFFGTVEQFFKQPLDGDAIRLADVEADPIHLAFDDEHVYFSLFNRPEILRVPRAGGEAEELARGQRRASSINVDDKYVYWSQYQNGTISRVPKGGGEVKILARGQKRIVGVTIDEKHIYWTREVEGSVHKMSKKGARSPSWRRGNRTTTRSPLTAITCTGTVGEKATTDTRSPAWPNPAARSRS